MAILLGHMGPGKHKHSDKNNQYPTTITTTGKSPPRVLNPNNKDGENMSLSLFFSVDSLICRLIRYDSYLIFSLALVST
jgi:hypothetical protein